MVKDFESSPSEGGAVVPLPRRATAYCADGAIDVVVTRLDLRPAAVRALAVWLSDAERIRASRFAFDRDRRRFVVTRARLRQLLGVRLDVRPESVELVYGERGKPALARGYAGSDLRFNVSDSDDVAGYAFSPGREMGIDVEAVRVILEADDVGERAAGRGAPGPCSAPTKFFAQRIARDVL